MKECIICGKELNDDVSIPICDYDMGQLKEKGVIVGSTAAAGALFSYIRKHPDKASRQIKNAVAMFSQLIEKVNKI